MKKTKIVSTLGPASNDVETITKLAEAGANVFRFNFSHGDHEEHRARMNMVREIEKKTGKLLGIALDTKGAEIRTTEQEGGKFTINTGDTIRISMDDTKKGNKDMIHVTYDGLYDDTHVGGHVLIDDGLVDLLIKEKDDTKRELVCEAQNTGLIGSKKGVNAPGVEIRLPGITEKDTNDIKFGLKEGINFIFASFVRKAQDVLDIRQLLEEAHCEYVKIFPKIESQEGIDNIDEILKVSDGLMVARGDMGVEIPEEEVPIIQKMIIKKVIAAGKVVITATQMLDSMMKNPRPTRAETTDVANAIYDGTSAIMLSGETAAGAYPVEAVQMMAKIAKRTEEAINYRKRFDDMAKYTNPGITDAICHATCSTAYDLDAKAIITVTKTGFSARMIAKYRPGCDIIGCAMDEKVCRQLNLSWGVQPILLGEEWEVFVLFERAINACKKEGLLENGDITVITSGVPIGRSGTTNMLKVQVVAD